MSEEKAEQVAQEIIVSEESSKSKSAKRSELLGVGANKYTQFGKWYTNVVTRAELIDYYDISGCYILRPESYAIWEEVQRFFDTLIRKSGVKNAYFPLFVTKSALFKEKNHIEGFSPEVAWVTRSGDSELAEPIAIRPTSETIMYPSVAKWVHSHRDLPLRLNQWTNVVRWEFKDAIPFIRSREFLWQEGHSAFATFEEAEKEVLEILDYYRRVYEELLAIPVIPGKKSENEKFAGADYTTTVESFIPAIGRAVQGATSHCLGQNFSKMFDINFLSENGDKQFAVQNSWGLSTRTLGILIMTHGDQKGLVLPPRAAPTQVVIIPIQFKGINSDEINEMCDQVCDQLCLNGIRAIVDKRQHKPGFKFNHWEVRGIPIKLEIGPKEVESKEVVLSRRDRLSHEKQNISTSNLVADIRKELEEMQSVLFERAKEDLYNHIVRITNWPEFVPALNKKNAVIAPWCEEVECENDIKKKSSAESQHNFEQVEEGEHILSGAAKSLCIPFKQPPESLESLPCFSCGKQSKSWCLFGRSY